MPADKSEVVFLEHISSSGFRRWRRAHLLLDPVAGLISLRFKEGPRKKKALEWQVSQIESFDVEMQPTPHSSIYERAFAVLLLLLATNLTLRFNLEDTFFEPLGELVPLLLAAGLAVGLSYLVKVPVIRFRVPDAVQQREKPHPVYGPVQQALRERMQRELEKQGKAVTEAGLDTMMKGDEALPESIEKINSRLFRASATFDPGTFRLHGGRWGSIKKTQSLAQRLEQTLIEHRAADVMPGQWRDLPWQRSRIIATLSRLTALLIILGGLGYFLWIPLDQLLFDHPADFSKVQPGDLEANFQTMSGKGTVNVAAVSPDRALIALGGGWGVFVYDAITYEEIWRGSTYHPVYSLAWSPDGNRLAAGEGNGVITLWNTEKWEWQAAFYGHQGFVRALAFSPDSLSLASGAEDRQVIIWNVDTAEINARLDHPAASLDWSPDGSALALGTYDGQIKLWDISHAQVVWEAEAGQGWVNEVAFSSDGQQITTVSTLDGITLWDASTGDKLQTFAQDLEIGDAARSPDESRFLIGTMTGDIIEIDSSTGDTLSASKFGYPIYDVDWLSNGMLLVMPVEGEILALHTEDTSAHLFYGYSGQVWDAAWKNDTLIWTFNSERGQRWEHPGEGFPYIITGGRLLAFSPDGTRLALAGDHGIVIRDMETQDITVALPIDLPIPARITWIDDRQLAIRVGDDRVEIWDTATEEFLRTLPIPEQETMSYGIKSLAASPDGSHIAVGLLGSAITLDAETGATIHTYDGLPGSVSDLAYSPPDGALLSAVAGRTCIVWDTTTHQERYRFTVDDEGLTRVIWSPDGILVAAGSLTGKVTIWGVGGRSAGQQVLSIEPFDRLQPVGGLAWSPDGETLAVGSWDGTLVLWDIIQH